MILEDIIRLPNLKPFSGLEVNMINRFLYDFPFMYRYHGQILESNDPKAIKFLDIGILGLGFADNQGNTSVVVAKLSEGRGLFGGDRIRFHVYDNCQTRGDEHLSVGSWKFLNILLVKIGNYEHLPKIPGPRY